jgi:hypothetical protein
VEALVARTLSPVSPTDVVVTVAPVSIRNATVLPEPAVWPKGWWMRLTELPVAEALTVSVAAVLVTEPAPLATVAV